MREPTPWTPLGDGVWSLRTRVRRHAFSPDDAHLAWCEGLDERTVHVTELATMRTVASLEGAAVRALHWSSPETLRVLRQTGTDATLHAHAVPDGGEVATVALPAVGLWPILRASRDGQVALVCRESWTWDHAPSVAAWVLRGERGDEVSRLDPLALVTPRRFAASGSALFALSPDGERLAVVLNTGTSPEPTGALASRVFFVSLRGEVDTHALTTLDRASLVRWIAPSNILAAFENSRGEGAMLCIDAQGREREAARWSRPDELLRGGFDLHPDRSRAVFTLRHATWEDFSCHAATLTLPSAAAPRAPFARVELSRQEWTADARPLDGGACWDARGDLVTLSVTASDEALLARHDAPDGAARVLARFALTGPRPRRLALRASPLRTNVLATWQTAEGSDDVSFRGLARIAL